jgi:phosphoribosylformylglycinamidine (FGAM) synthase PurS component
MSNKYISLSIRKNIEDKSNINNEKINLYQKVKENIKNISSFSFSEYDNKDYSELNLDFKINEESINEELNAFIDDLVINNNISSYQLNIENNNFL